MKFIETILLFALVALPSFWFFVFRTETTRPAGKTALRAVAILSMGVLVACAYFGMTPWEREATLTKDYILQRVMFGEAVEEDFRYKEALVVVPKVLPLPTIAGKLAVVAGPETRLEYYVSDTTLHVTASPLKPGGLAAIRCASLKVHELRVEISNGSGYRACPG